jgi:tetratricopeptide (TPR) repeat protein
MKEAEEAFQEALSTYRKLAQDNPQAYLPNVATTLNNLAILYRETQRRKEAVGSCHEAAKLLEPQWQANPEVHGDQLARILLLLVLLSESGGESAGDPCAFARRAFEVAYQPDLKRVAIELINQLCEEGRP